MSRIGSKCVSLTQHSKQIQLELKGKSVIRADYNVPLKNGQKTDSDSSVKALPNQKHRGDLNNLINLAEKEPYKYTCTGYQNIRRPRQHLQTNPAWERAAAAPELTRKMGENTTCSLSVTEIWGLLGYNPMKANIPGLLIFLLN